MKRFLAFILSLIFLVTTTGITMHMHFCMGELADWSVWNKDDKKECGKCGMKKDDKPSGCCNDEQKWVKMECDQKVNLHTFQMETLDLVHHQEFFNYDYSFLVLNTRDLVPNSHAPPPNRIAIYKRNCVFLI